MSSNPDLTIIYYTANQEDPVFERNIQKALVDASGGVPIISVSHKPIDFGQNICVGDVGRSGVNIYRQMRIGAKAAKTKFVCPAESDMLYPPSYFTFRPDSERTAYIAEPLYVLFDQRGRKRYFALKPRGSEAAMVVGRDYLIGGIDQMLAGFDQWDRTDEHAESVQHLLRILSRKRFNVSYPVISIKTDRNLHRKTPHSSADVCRELPVWGSALDIIHQMRSDGR